VGYVDWTHDTDEITTLMEASKTFYEKLDSDPMLSQTLITKLEAYEDGLADCGMHVETDEVENLATKIPSHWAESSAAAQQLAESVYKALEVIATAVCRCPALPEPHSYETRFPLLAHQPSKNVLKLQMRKLQDKWQYAWIGVATRWVSYRIRLGSSLMERQV
jgi:hypothetical protein